jgi:hypothetical protein
MLTYHLKVFPPFADSTSERFDNHCSISLKEIPMLCVEDLVNLDPFQQLSQERLEWVCEHAQTVKLGVGEFLVHEGDPACGLFILIAGK